MKNSAGILLYRSNLEVLLGHPGGPFYANKDTWVIPKGEIEPSEDPFECAKRELFEESGIVTTNKPFFLGTFKQSNMKTIHIWAVNQDYDISKFCINTIPIIYKDKEIMIPELDQINWFNIKEAKVKVLSSQKQVLEKLEDVLR